MENLELPYSLKFSRIKYFVVWLNSAQKQIFADKIFVVERESRKVHTYVRIVWRGQPLHERGRVWSHTNTCIRDRLPESGSRRKYICTRELTENRNLCAWCG